MPLAVSVRDQANLERRLWDRREALPQVDLDMSAPGAVTVVSGAVSSLADRTGRYTVSQATSTLRPAFTENALNGFPVATGDSVDDRLVSTSNTGLTNNVPGVTMCIVARANSASLPNTWSAFVVSTPTASSGRVRLRARATTFNGWGSSIRRLDADGASSQESSVGTGFNTYKVAALTFNAQSTSSNVTLRENGTQTATGTHSGSAANTSSTNPAQMTFGGDNAGTNGFFTMASGLVFHQAHPGWMMQKVEGDQAHQWGLAGSLALGHPCQSRPPLRGPG